MSLLYGNANGVSFVVPGDGVSTVLTVDLTAAPILMDLSGNNPAGVLGPPPGNGYSISLVDTHKVRVTFDVPPAQGTHNSVQFVVLFPGI